MSAGIPLDELPLFWRGRAQALRELHSRWPNEGTLARAEIYETCADELSAATTRTSLAHAARCKSASIKVHICRLRKKLPPGTTIPRSFYGVQTYHLEQEGRIPCKGRMK